MIMLLLAAAVTLADARFEAFNQDMTADQAHASCISKGGVLAKINNDIENAEALNIAESAGMWKFWIGISRIGPGSSIENFQWRDGTSVEYTNWLHDEPNFHKNKEHCAVIGNGDVRGEPVWNDVRCDKTFGYLCSFDVRMLSTDAPESTTDGSYNGCANFDNWVDRDGDGCEMYAFQEWCADGGIGRMWQSSVSYSTFAASGVDATVACCVCGGGLTISAAPTTETVSNTPTVAEFTPTTTEFVPTTIALDISITNTLSTQIATTDSTNCAFPRWVNQIEGLDIEPALDDMFSHIKSIGSLLGRVESNIRNDDEPELLPLELSCLEACTGLEIGLGCRPCTMLPNAECVITGPLGSGLLCRTEEDGSEVPCCSDHENSTCTLPESCNCDLIADQIVTVPRAINQNQQLPDCSNVSEVNTPPACSEQEVRIDKLLDRLANIGDILAKAKPYKYSVGVHQMDCESYCNGLLLGSSCSPCPASFHSTEESCLSPGPFGNGELCREHTDPTNETASTQIIPCCEFTTGALPNCLLPRSCDCSGYYGPAEWGFRPFQATFDHDTNTCTHI